MHRPTHQLTGEKPHLPADLNALVLYALLLGMFSMFLIGGLTARPTSVEHTSGDSVSTQATHTSGHEP